jgi:glycosyltransferase involved in cell wall biosynthesis
MNKKTLKYYAFLGAENSPGIVQKIENTVEAAREIGYESENCFFVNRPKGLIDFIKAIIVGKEDIVILRLYDLFMPFIFPFLMIRRMRGTRLILDVPTPRAILIKEFSHGGKSRTHIFLRKTWNYFSWTWVLLPFHRIIQSADESKWFSFMVSGKTIKIGNGIKVDHALPLVGQERKKNFIQLIIVANLSKWHGVDRLIKAIDLINKNHPDIQVNLKIVGYGPALSELKNLVERLSLAGQVNFTGLLRGSDLTDAFKGANFGVSSLGNSRIGLEKGSALKTREYMARGLCVIGSGGDPDFNEDSPYRYLVPNDESIEPIVNLLLSLVDKNLPTPSEVRIFAETKLSYRSKIEKIINNEFNN